MESHRTKYSIIGEVVGGRYTVLELIGEGGMGNVYLAEHTMLEKKVAVKILHLEQSRKKETLERFKREAIAASNIGQDNIVDVTDFGYTPVGNAYFVMEYIDGVSLAEHLRTNGPVLPLYFGVSVASQIAFALFRAHKMGIIHRDLKPENILITEKENTYPFVKIVDFGISKIQSTDDSGKKQLTKAGAIFGTPEYMSPEQAGGKDVSPSSDIYSLGILMYEMFTGTLPFVDDNYMKVLHKHQYEIPNLPSAVNSTLPSALDKIVMHCLEKHPDKRFPSMFELLGALQTVYTGEKLYEKLNLSFLFDSTLLNTLPDSERSMTASDVTKYLNSPRQHDTEENLSDRDLRQLSGGRSGWWMVLVGVIIIIAAVSGLLYLKRSRGPVTVTRTVHTDADAFAGTDADNVKQALKEPGEKKPPKKRVKKKRKRPNRSERRKKKVRRKIPAKRITMKVKSNVDGISVYDKDRGKYLCKTPCSLDLKQDPSGVMILGFQKENYTIKPIVVRLDRNITVNVDLRTDTQ